MRRQEYLKSIEELKTSKSPLGKETSFSSTVPGKGIRSGPPDVSIGDTPGETVGEDQEIDVKKILEGKKRSSKVEDIDPGSKRINLHESRMEIIRTDPEYLNMLKYYPGFGVEDNVLSSRLWSKHRLKGIIRDGDMEIISDYFRGVFGLHSDKRISYPVDTHEFLLTFAKRKERAIAVLKACVEYGHDYQHSSDGEDVVVILPPANLTVFLESLRKFKGKKIRYKHWLDTSDKHWASRMVVIGAWFESDPVEVKSQMNLRSNHVMRDLIDCMINREPALAIAMETAFPGVLEFLGCKLDDMEQKVLDEGVAPVYNHESIHQKRLKERLAQPRTTLYGEPR